jgi:amino acid permease
VLESYSDIAFGAGGPYLRTIVDLCTCASQVSYCVYYLSGACAVATELAPSLSFNQWLVLFTCFEYGMSMLTHNLSLLAVLTYLAGYYVLVALVASFGLIMQNLLQGGVDASVTSTGDPSLYIPMVGGIFSVTTIIAVILPVENSLSPKDKRDFPNTLRRTLVGCFCVLCGFGLAGYLAFGDRLQTSIVAALDPKGAGWIAKIALASNLVLSTPLQAVPALQLLDRWFNATTSQEPRPYRSVRAMVVRAVMYIAVSGGLSLMGPDALIAFADFTGSTCVGVIALIVPPIIRLLTTREYYSAYDAVRARHVAPGPPTKRADGSMSPKRPGTALDDEDDGTADVELDDTIVVRAIAETGMLPPAKTEVAGAASGAVAAAPAVAGPAAAQSAPSSTTTTHSACSASVLVPSPASSLTTGTTATTAHLSRGSSAEDAWAHLKEPDLWRAIVFPLTFQKARCLVYVFCGLVLLVMGAWQSLASFGASSSASSVVADAPVTSS